VGLPTTLSEKSPAVI